MPKESAVEAGYARHKPILGTVLKFSAKLVEATGFPGAQAVAGLMTAVVDAANMATENIDNCKQLVVLVWACDEALAQVEPSALEQYAAQLQKLKDALAATRDLVVTYGQGKGMLMRLVMSARDAEKFGGCHTALTDAMAVSGACSRTRGG
jgi:hypothetical protein